MPFCNKCEMQDGDFVCLECKKVYQDIEVVYDPYKLFSKA